MRSLKQPKRNSWLLLLYSLPTHRSTERVAIWRRFKKIGAVQIKTSAYLLPDQPAQYEHFQWLVQQIRDYGGDATLVRAQGIEGLPNEKLIALFHRARDQEYAVVKKALQAFLLRPKKKSGEADSAELERLIAQFREIHERDFFESARGHEIQMLLRQAEGETKRKLPRLDPKNYSAKTWMTRPRPEIDRVGSAWLIRKFIDPKAKFVFASSPESNRGAIPFDMVDAEFSHHEECCTFETLVRRFAMDDKAVRKIGEMIHDADLDDAKFQRVECIGIDRVFKGWGKTALTDQEILTAGFTCFDGLYEFLQRR